MRRIPRVLSLLSALGLLAMAPSAYALDPRFNLVEVGLGAGRLYNIVGLNADLNINEYVSLTSTLPVSFADNGNQMNYGVKVGLNKVNWVARPRVSLLYGVSNWNDISVSSGGATAESGDIYWHGWKAGAGIKFLFGQGKHIGLDIDYHRQFGTKLESKWRGDPTVAALSDKPMDEIVSVGIRIAFLPLETFKK